MFLIYCQIGGFNDIANEVSSILKYDTKETDL